MDEEEEVPDPTQPSLGAISDAGHCFSIPWSREVRTIMAGFDSTRMKDVEGPWKLSSPFDLGGVRANLTTIVPDGRGNTTSFRDGYSTKSGSTTDHMSAALGLTVGYPFLNASVTGEYDRTVTKNQNGVQASRNCSCRVGRLVLNETPPLSKDAILLLRSKGGPTRFHKAFGDYYIHGYELGADAGACLSGSTLSERTDERLAITVAVKLLFYETSHTETTTFSSSSASASFTFCGFSTLEKEPAKLESKDAPVTAAAPLQAAAAQYLRKVGGLDEEVRAVMSQLRLFDGESVPLAYGSSVCEAGLVVQLLMAPFARLVEYVNHASSN